MEPEAIQEGAGGFEPPGKKCRFAWPSGPDLDRCFINRGPVTTQPQFWSSRRCRVGGPSSVLLGSLVVLLGSVLARRRDGFLVSLESVRRRLFSIRASRALMSSNSEVVTVYSSRAGRMRAISSCEC